MKGQGFPCGKCLPCLFNRRRMWTHRIMLEAAQYTDNTFATLTYADEHLPRTLGDLPTLAPEHTRNFLKRLRKSISPIKLRFYLAGEYGDETQRPHYHAALFNIPSCQRGTTGFGMVNPDWSTCCAACKLVGENWGFGKIYLGSLETSSAQYVAGYVTKKMTMRTDPRLRGREPEYSRKSLKPGIGGDAMHEVASTFLQFNLETTQGDVPLTLRHGSRELPLGRYLRRRLRKLIGKDEKTPQQVLDLIKEEMRPVQEAAFNASVSYASALKKENAGHVAAALSRQSVKQHRRKIL